LKFRFSYRATAASTLIRKPKVHFFGISGPFSARTAFSAPLVHGGRLQVSQCTFKPKVLRSPAVAARCGSSA